MTWQYMAVEWLSHLFGVTITNLCPVPFGITHPAPVKYAQFGANLSARDGLVAVRENKPPRLVRVYDLKTHALLLSLAPPENPHPESPYTVAVGNGRVALSVIDNTGRHVNVYEGGKLVQSLSSPTPNDPGLFGRAVDTDGNYVVVGAPFTSKGSAAWLYDLENPQQPIALANPQPGFKLFGLSVAVDGGIVAVGAPYQKTKSGGDLLAGAVHLFDVKGKPLRTIENPVPLKNPPQMPWLAYGFPMALRSGALVLGDPWQPVSNTQQAGIVYVYDPVSEASPIIIPNPKPVDLMWFGLSVSAGETFVAVNTWDRNYPPGGSLPKNHASSVGLFTRPNGYLSCFSKNPSSDEWNAFATGPVSADGDRYVVGAWGETVNGIEFAGAIYLYAVDLAYQYAPPEPIPIVPPDIFPPHRPVANPVTPRPRQTPRRRRPR